MTCAVLFQLQNFRRVCVAVSLFKFRQCEDYSKQYKPYTSSLAFHLCLLQRGFFDIVCLHFHWVFDKQWGLEPSFYDHPTWTGLNKVCACARSHGLRWRQRPGRRTKPRKKGGWNFRPRTEQWPCQMASGDLGVLFSSCSLNKLASPLTGLCMCAIKQ